jgi:mono/diheme cytochrome c family protein
LLTGIVALGVLAAVACTHEKAQSEKAQSATNADLIAEGRAVAVSQCGSCHALDLNTQSPRADAPAFRTIGKRYRFPVLEEELIQGIKLGHPDMPKFQLSPLGVDALIAYLRSLQEADRTSAQPGARKD